MKGITSERSLSRLRDILFVQHIIATTILPLKDRAKPKAQVSANGAALSERRPSFQRK